MLLLVLTSLYFLPTLIAFAKGKRNRASIFVVNLFLGWTLWGWVVAFAWSVAVDVAVIRPAVPLPSPVAETIPNKLNEQQDAVRELLDGLPPQKRSDMWNIVFGARNRGQLEAWLHEMNVEPELTSELVAVRFSAEANAARCLTTMLNVNRLRSP
jgi:Superinfection immunity protein